jgi:hypothetical protein
MWPSTVISSLETLSPRTPADCRVLYTLVKDEMSAMFPTRTAIVRRLAMVAVRHLQGEGQHVLIRGPGESGRDSMVRALVRILDLPFIEIDVGALAETNWAGSDLPFFLDQLRMDLVRRYSVAQAPLLAERACILVSGLDRARLATSYGGASNREHRIGKQAAIAQLLRSAPIPVTRDHSAGFMWRGDRALIVATAEFAELPRGNVSSSDLRSWGMLPDIADPIASGIFISVDAPSSSEIERLLRSQLAGFGTRFLQFGYHLKVEEQVIRFITGVIADGTYGGGVSAGVSWIGAAVDAALTRLLDSGARSGTTWVLSRDDISLPKRPRGLWRE